MVEQEIAVYGSPNGLRTAGLSDPAAKGWLTFQGNVTRDSKLSDLLTGRLNTESVSPVDTGNPEQVVAHLFSQIDLVPVSLEQFRDYCTAQLPSSDDALLDYGELPGNRARWLRQHFADVARHQRQRARENDHAGRADSRAP